MAEEQVLTSDAATWAVLRHEADERLLLHAAIERSIERCPRGFLSGGMVIDVLGAETGHWGQDWRHARRVRSVMVSLGYRCASRRGFKVTWKCCRFKPGVVVPDRGCGTNGKPRVDWRGAVSVGDGLHDPTCQRP
jgi:hypothetical protein